MDKYTELEKQAQKFLDETDTMQFSTVELLTMFYEHQKQLTLTDVSKRYDANKYTPPFRVGRKQGKAVLDGKGIEVVFFNNSEEQAKIYCDYLNNVC